MSRYSYWRNTVRATVVIVGLTIAGALQASTVLQMGFSEVVDTAELVFEGKVLAAESRRVPDGMIHTFVTFAVLDVLKGDYAAGEIELSFLGGQVGTQRLQVTDMEVPEVGESGFYFVESLANAQVNPLVGWAQGHYLIEDGSVTTANHEPVLGFAPEPVLLTPTSNEFSKGVAKGIVIQGVGSASRLSRGISIDEFKEHVRITAENSR